MVTLRKYTSADCGEMAKLFYDTVHSVNARDYTQKQLDAWADGHVEPKAWEQSFLDHNTVVAVEKDTIVGFGDMDSSGYLDRLYVHRDYQRRGIATRICEELEKNVDARCIRVHASITAKGFFEGRGYVTVRKQQVERNGVFLTNYRMEKRR